MNQAQGNNVKEEAYTNEMLHRILGIAKDNKSTAQDILNRATNQMDDLFGAIPPTSQDAVKSEHPVAWSEKVIKELQEMSELLAAIHSQLDRL